MMSEDNDGRGSRVKSRESRVNGFKGSRVEDDNNSGRQFSKETAKLPLFACKQLIFISLYGMTVLV